MAVKKEIAGYEIFLKEYMNIDKTLEKIQNPQIYQEIRR